MLQRRQKFGWQGSPKETSPVNSPRRLNRRSQPKSNNGTVFKQNLEDAEKLEQAINSHAAQSWRVISCASAQIPGFSGNREEMIVISERDNEFMMKSSGDGDANKRPYPDHNAPMPGTRQTADVVFLSLRSTPMPSLYPRSAFQSYAISSWGHS